MSKQDERCKMQDAGFRIQDAGGAKQHPVKRGCRWNEATSRESGDADGTKRHPRWLGAGSVKEGFRIQDASRAKRHVCYARPGSAKRGCKVLRRLRSVSRILNLVRLHTQPLIRVGLILLLFSPSICIGQQQFQRAGDNSSPQAQAKTHADESSDVFIELSEETGGQVQIGAHIIDYTDELKQLEKVRLYLPPVYQSEFLYLPKTGEFREILPTSRTVRDIYDDAKQRYGEMSRYIGDTKVPWYNHLMGNYYSHKVLPTLDTLSEAQRADALFPAIEKYKLAILDDPTFAPSYLNLCSIYLSLERKQAAARELKLAEKYNLAAVQVDIVSADGGIVSQNLDLFGIASEIDALKMQIPKEIYDKTDVRFDISLYSIPEGRLDHKESLDKSEADVETLVETLAKYGDMEARSRLYYNLAHHYYEQKKYHLALQTCHRYFSSDAYFYRSALPVEVKTAVRKLVAKTFKNLNWMEWEEIDANRNFDFFTFIKTQ